MLTKKDVKKLLNAVYYHGEYVVKYHEYNADGSFYIGNEYLGFPSYDSDGFLNLLTSKNYVTIYEMLTAYPPDERLLTLLRATFPDKKVEVGMDSDDGTEIYYITITF